MSRCSAACKGAEQRRTRNPLSRPRRASQRFVCVASSVLLCISTLLDGSNHYTKMINLTDETGAKVFESLQISLVCESCLKTEHPEKYAMLSFPACTAACFHCFQHCLPISNYQGGCCYCSYRCGQHRFLLDRRLCRGIRLLSSDATVDYQFVISCGHSNLCPVAWE